MTAPTIRPPTCPRQSMLENVNDSTRLTTIRPRIPPDSSLHRDQREMVVDARPPAPGCHSGSGRRRQDEDDDVETDQGEGDVGAGMYPAAVHCPGRAHRAAALGDAVRALEADRRGHHASRA